MKMTTAAALGGAMAGPGGEAQTAVASLCRTYSGDMDCEDLREWAKSMIAALHTLNMF